MKTKKRFIAGAVCPRCATMDSIVMYEDEAGYHRQCVQCDFSETTRFSDDEVATPEAEIKTRVNTPLVTAQQRLTKEQRERNKAQPVKIIGDVKPDKT